VHDERQTLVLDPECGVAARDGAGQPRTQRLDLGWHGRRRQRPADPGLHAVQARDNDAGHRYEPAQANDRLGVTSGDDRDLRAGSGEVGEGFDRTRQRARRLRVDHDGGEGAVEVEGDQRSLSCEARDHVVKVHSPILPTLVTRSESVGRWMS